MRIHFSEKLSKITLMTPEASSIISRTTCWW